MGLLEPFTGSVKIVQSPWSTQGGAPYLVPNLVLYVMPSCCDFVGHVEMGLELETLDRTPIEGGLKGALVMRVLHKVGHIEFAGIEFESKVMKRGQYRLLLSVRLEEEICHIPVTTFLWTSSSEGFSVDAIGNMGRPGESARNHVSKNGVSFVALSHGFELSARMPSLFVARKVEPNDMKVSKEYLSKGMRTLPNGTFSSGKNGFVDESARMLARAKGEILDPGEILDIDREMVSGGYITQTPSIEEHRRARKDVTLHRHLIERRWNISEILAKGIAEEELMELVAWERAFCIQELNEQLGLFEFVFPSGLSSELNVVRNTSQLESFALSSPCRLDITVLLSLPQKMAADRLEMTPPTFSKRFKKSNGDRRWPYRQLCVINKRIENAARSNSDVELYTLRGQRRKLLTCSYIDAHEFIHSVKHTVSAEACDSLLRSESIP